MADTLTAQQIEALKNAYRSVGLDDTKINQQSDPNALLNDMMNAPAWANADEIAQKRASLFEQMRTPNGVDVLDADSNVNVALKALNELPDVVDRFAVREAIKNAFGDDWSALDDKVQERLNDGAKVIDMSWRSDPRNQDIVEDIKLNKLSKDHVPTYRGGLVPDALYDKDRNGQLSDHEYAQALDIKPEQAKDYVRTHTAVVDGMSITVGSVAMEQLDGLAGRMGEIKGPVESKNAEAAMKLLFDQNKDGSWDRNEVAAMQASLEVNDKFRQALEDRGIDTKQLVESIRGSLSTEIQHNTDSNMGGPATNGMVLPKTTGGRTSP